MFRTLPSGVEKSQKHFAICKIKYDQRYGSCRYVVFVRHDITNAVFFLELIHNSHLMDFERNIEARHGEKKADADEYSRSTNSGTNLKSEQPLEDIHSVMKT